MDVESNKKTPPPPQKKKKKKIVDTSPAAVVVRYKRLIQFPSNKRDYLFFFTKISFSWKPKKTIPLKIGRYRKTVLHLASSTQAIFLLRQATYTWVLILIYRQTRFFTEGSHRYCEAFLFLQRLCNFLIYCQRNFTFFYLLKILLLRLLFLTLWIKLFILLRCFITQGYHW